MSQDESKLEGTQAVRQELWSTLKDLKIKDLKYNKNPVILDSSTDPRKAIEILVQNHIRAAPVQEKKEFIGVLDLRDTVKYALQSYQQGTVDTSKAKAMEFLTVAPQISTQSLKYLSRMRPFYCVPLSDSINTVLHAFAKGSHIVGVASEDGSKLVGVITQGQLFQQIAKKWVFDTDVKLSVLAKEKYITSPVVCIHHSAKAYDSFEKMGTSNLSGLAVIDDDGKIIHNTSATDIKLWLIASNSLDETIEQFLISIRKLSLMEKYPITVCTMNDGIKRAIGKLQATKYHRLWVVDQEGRPVGVLALTDVFRLIDHLQNNENNHDQSNQNNQNDQNNQNNQNQSNQDNTNSSSSSSSQN